MAVVPKSTTIRKSLVGAALHCAACGQRVSSIGKDCFLSRNKHLTNDGREIWTKSTYSSVSRDWHNRWKSNTGLRPSILAELSTSLNFFYIFFTADEIKYYTKIVALLGQRRASSTSKSSSRTLTIGATMGIFSWTVYPLSQQKINWSLRIIAQNSQYAIEFCGQRVSYRVKFNKYFTIQPNLQANEKALQFLNGIIWTKKSQWTIHTKSRSGPGQWHHFRSFEPQLPITTAQQYRSSERQLRQVSSAPPLVTIAISRPICEEFANVRAWRSMSIKRYKWKTSIALLICDAR